MGKTINTILSSDAANVRPGSALLIVDMLSDFNFEDGDKLFRNAAGIVENIHRLRLNAELVGVPVIYINDSFGKSDQDFRDHLTELKKGSEKVRRMLEKLEPGPGDHIILKPQRSGFYATALGVLLMSLNVTSLIVTGVTTDICVLFTAHDAYMRGFHVTVPEDCCAAVEQEHHSVALTFLRRVAEADTSTSDSLLLPSRAQDLDEIGSMTQQEEFRIGQPFVSIQ